MTNEPSPFEFSNKRRSLLIDMDDCVADWLGAACSYLDFEWTDTETHIPLYQWDRLLKNQRFYRDLPLKVGATELMAWAAEYANTHGMNLAFLTAIPHNNDVPFVFQDKIHWANTHFPHVPVFFGPYSTDKHLHCRPGDILIDDRRDNCADWINTGGIAHVYSTWENCKEWIDLELAECVSAR